MGEVHILRIRTGSQGRGTANGGGDDAFVSMHPSPTNPHCYHFHQKINIFHLFSPPVLHYYRRR